MIEDLERIRTEALEAIRRASSIGELERVVVTFLGRRGSLSLLLQGIGELPNEERPGVGRRANEIKRELQQAALEKRTSLAPSVSPLDTIDPTWLGPPQSRGHLHPITQFLRRVESTFVSMGFEVVEGPELETERYNFDLLNIPKEHPSRDVWDTFYVDPPKARLAEGGQPKTGKRKTNRDQLLLRTHTSPMQIRIMEKRKPPVRIVVPGRVFRREATDASHETTFYQCEGLVIDRGVRVTDLIGTLDAFLKAIFGEDVRTRVRPHYYPFVEPGMDIDMSCLVCGGKGCSVCGGDGWLEMLGSGMVHPNVLKNMKVDPKVYSGFAFGLGIDRMVMLYHGIDDIRLFYSGNVKFLEQF